MSIPINQFPSIEQMTERLNVNKSTAAAKQAVGTPFSEILKEKQAAGVVELKFSKHANERMASRNIDLTDEQYRRLENGAMLASRKGILESLVMVDNLAFIVNIKNNTVVTAVNDGEEKVFTNIDGAVIA
jgi:flagellar operon protein